MRVVGDVACMRKLRNAYKILVRKPEGKSGRECTGYVWLRIGISSRLL